MLVCAQGVLAVSPEKITRFKPWEQAAKKPSSKQPGSMSISLGICVID